jgi:hypothetical protein
MRVKTFLSCLLCFSVRLQEAEQEEGEWESWDTSNLGTIQVTRYRLYIYRSTDKNDQVDHQRIQT